MAILKRIKKLWKLSKDAKQLAELPKGKGKAVFFSEGTDEDFIEQGRKDAGLSGWYKRIRNL